MKEKKLLLMGSHPNDFSIPKNVGFVLEKTTKKQNNIDIQVALKTAQRKSSVVEVTVCQKRFQLFEPQDRTDSPENICLT